MLYPTLVELQEKAVHCRQQTLVNKLEPCYPFIHYKSHGNHSVQLLVPPAQEITEKVGVVTIGINPMWQLPLDAPTQEVSSRKDRGDRFHTYVEQILKDVRLVLSSGSVVHMELVQCGSPGKGDVMPIICHCRSLFFDKAINTLQPKVVVPIGRFACEHLYWYCTPEGQAGRSWGTMTERHATIAQAVIGEHECKVVFVTQPARGVSTEERGRAGRAIVEAYGN